MATTYWTLVQHSATSTGHNEFAQAVEEVAVPNNATQRRLILQAGGVLFTDYAQASDAAEAANYPPGVTSLVPNARGFFHGNLSVGLLPVYIPDSDIRNLLVENA